MAPDPLPAALEAASTIRVLASGELLFRQGDPAAAVYKVESGRLRLTRRTVDDHLVILHTARQGEFFAEASLFADAYHCEGVAAVRSSVRIYPKDIVMGALRADSSLAQAFMARLARQLQELRSRMELRNIRPARDRVLQYLRVCADDGRKIELDRPLQDIAAEIGMSREALYRTLATLEAEGHLTRTETEILLQKSDAV